MGIKKVNKGDESLLSLLDKTVLISFYKLVIQSDNIFKGECFKKIEIIMLEKIKDFYENQKFVRITRKVAKDWEELSRGYIIDYSKDFVILQESDDFNILGYNILPIKDIIHIRHNNNDKYYDKIMSFENEKKKIGIKYKVDLTSWKSIFINLQKIKKNVIVECENPEIDSFTIGPISRISDKSVFIQYFNASGYIDENSTKIKFKNISKIIFDDRYIEVFSKYIRERKKKKNSIPKD